MAKGGGKANGAAATRKEKSLYEVLGVEKEASQQEIKKAYHKLALRLHPDKNPGDEEAKDKFQKLQAVFGVLGDSEKRKVYDETGSIDAAELGGENFNNLYDYYRDMFQRVSEEDIEAFEEKYRGSEEESRDLKEFFTRFSGDMPKVFEFLMCSQPEIDSHRFRETLDAAIVDGELETSSKYKKWAKSVSKLPPVADPLAKSSKKKKGHGGKEDGGDMSGLILAMQAKHKERAQSLFSSLENKYCQKEGKGKKQARDNVEPTEEEFAAARERMEKKIGKRKDDEEQRGAKSKGAKKQKAK